MQNEKATALKENKPQASSLFELRLDDLKVLEGLLDLENAALHPRSKNTFHLDFGQ